MPGVTLDAQTVLLVVAVVLLLAQTVTDARPDPAKAPCLISVTLEGISIDVKAVQFMKALSPMLVRVLGRVTDVRVWKPRKAFAPMAVIPSLMMMVVTFNWYCDQGKGSPIT